MFDYFDPVPELNCPRCGRVLSDWQGKDAEDALFLWRQGVLHPVMQCIDDESCRLTAEDLIRFTLPDEFTIYTHCSCSTKYFIEAFGEILDGVWHQTRLMKPEEIEEMYGRLPRSERKSMRKWLQMKV
jgi:hypothetical protein